MPADCLRSSRILGVPLSDESAERLPLPLTCGLGLQYGMSAVAAIAVIPAMMRKRASGSGGRAPGGGVSGGWSPVSGQANSATDSTSRTKSACREMPCLVYIRRKSQ